MNTRTLTSIVAFEVETIIPTSHGSMRFRAYSEPALGTEHIAIISEPGGRPISGAPIVRVHSECLTGEALGSLKCDCGPQLEASMTMIGENGGVIIYMRGHEGRGIGLLDKLRAYRLQEDGLDTLDANLELGLPADGRDYAAAAAILEDLGIAQARLLSNNPEKFAQLVAHGVDVVDRIPLVLAAGEVSDRYLATKRDRMGHLID